MFDRGWESGTATIVARKPLSAGPHGITTRWSYVADVKPDAGTPTFRTTFDDLHLNGELISRGGRGCPCQVQAEQQGGEAGPV